MDTSRYFKLENSTKSFYSWAFILLSPSLTSYDPQVKSVASKNRPNTVKSIMINKGS